MYLHDTICAPATVPGTGAITVIRVSGPESFALVDRIFRSSRGRLSDAAGHTVLHGTVVDPSDGEAMIDEVLVSVFRAPHSYTGEDSAEISCHASAYVAMHVLNLLCIGGARMAEPGEFTRRAFVNGKMDLAQAEAVADVISSTSSAAHRLAVSQMKGGYSQELARIREALVEVTSLLELELDFSEEDVEFADRSHLRSLLASASGRIRQLSDSFRLGNAIKCGVPVVIVGAPNTGKSTLLNALVGEERAIVSDIAGTTRDSIEEQLVLDGISFRFIDTAGLRSSNDQIESKGIERAMKMLATADIVLALVDATRSPAEAGRLLTELLSRVDDSSQQLVVLVNKMDLNKNVNDINKMVSDSGIQRNVLNISALSGEGLDALRHTLVRLVQGRLSGTSDHILVTNARHHEALRLTAHDLDAALSALDAGIPSDLVAQDLRSALHHLGTITGAVTTDEVLGEIFGRFCIGK
ncbi:MAG: tRNA uridine-5-carboxymethylaminomethyl(34) synthesis GTPase MnmE [Bacteroidales bacterium]|nr:tRNA uridine-5-carboxymethylaminomethyl(34) synthesis GTPase MnmE [Bacteroidales bacterium]